MQPQLEYLAMIEGVSCSYLRGRLGFIETMDIHSFRVSIAGQAGTVAGRKSGTTNARILFHLFITQMPQVLYATMARESLYGISFPYRPPPVIALLLGISHNPSHAYFLERRVGSVNLKKCLANKVLT